VYLLIISKQSNEDVTEISDTEIIFNSADASAEFSKILIPTPSINSSYWQSDGHTGSEIYWSMNVLSFSCRMVQNIIFCFVDYLLPWKMQLPSLLMKLFGRLWAYVGTTYVSTINKNVIRVWVVPVRPWSGVAVMGLGASLGNSITHKAMYHVTWNGPWRKRNM
jgi:hypothetical protein